MLLLNDPIPVPSLVQVGNPICGPGDTLQQTPRTVMLPPPSLVILPPVVAVLEPILVTLFVVKAARVPVVVNSI
ncbi:MAG: hypothetical protein DDT30_02089 [Dehalococcoidia bacterium]|nr:hypothetical protein [Bacillota bacterium]